MPIAYIVGTYLVRYHWCGTLSVTDFLGNLGTGT